MPSPETISTILHWLPWIVLGVVGLKLYDKKMDSIQAVMQSMSKAAASLGLTDLEQFLDALARDAYEEAEALGKTFVTKYGSGDGLKDAVCTICEKSLGALLTDPKYAARLDPILAGAVLNMAFDDALKTSAGKIALELGKYGFDHSAQLAQAIATGKFDQLKSAIHSLEQVLLARNGVDRLAYEVIEKSLPVLKREPGRFAALTALWNSSPGPAAPAAPAAITGTPAVG